MTEAPTKEATTQATRIDGKAVAERLRLRIGGEAARLLALHGAAPGLAVVLVGEDPASQVYVRNKGIATRAAGLVSVEHRLPVSASQADVLALVATLNADPAIDGILVQLPLPQQISAKAVIEAIDPDKDVDGFHPVNTGRLWTDGGGLVPCTPQGCMLLLAGVRDRLAGLNALVVGRSSIVGKPMAALLLAADCTVTVAHSRSRDLPALARQTDILVAAVGRPAMIRGDWIRPGATVIDVGVNRIDAGQGKTRLVGDVAYDEAVPVAGAITPVPGGVGPMTIACLLRNTMIAAGRRRGWGELDL